MSAAQTEKRDLAKGSTKGQSEKTGKIFALTGGILFVINGIMALALGNAKVLMTAMPVSVVFMAVGAGLWAQGRKDSQKASVDAPKARASHDVDSVLRGRRDAGA